MKFLMWLVFFGLVAAALVSRLKSAGKPRIPDMPPPANDMRSDAEPMLQCAHCGLHFPASEAIHRGGQPYCSPEHAGQHGT